MLQVFNKNEHFNEFKLKPLSLAATYSNFDCGSPEYNDYLFYDASRSMNDHIALTWLLIEKASNKVAAYMSLARDTPSMASRA